MRHCCRMSKRKTRNGKRWTEDEARRMLSKQQASGKSVAKFAQDEGLVAERLYRWQRRLKKPTRKTRGKRADRSEFAEGKQMASGSSERRFEVVLASGQRVWVPDGFAAEDMARLVAVLEGQRC